MSSFRPALTGPTVSVREPSPCPPCARGRRPPTPRTQDPMGVGRRFLARGRESSPVCGVLAEGIDGPHIMIHNDIYGL